MNLQKADFKLPWAWGGLALALVMLHFHDLGIFQRELIRFDDVDLIAPLMDIGLTDYVTTWLVGENHFAFPLRDLSFLLDFWFGRTLNIQTFWLSNFLFFAATLILLSSMLKSLLPERRWLRFFVMAIIALHPLNVEIIQWASLRKHILVALFIAVGTARVLSVLRSGEHPGTKDWLVIVSSYVAALFCFPTAMLWIFWACFLLRAAFKAGDRNAWMGSITALIVMVILTWFSISNNDQYRELASENLRGSSLGAVNFGLQSLGRGFFDLVLPLRQVIYIANGNPMNWLGLAMFVGFVAWIGKAFWRKPLAANEHVGLSLVALAALLLLPSAFLFVNRVELVWSDRYLYVPLPYFVTGMTLILGEQQRVSNMFLNGRAAAAMLLVLVLCFVRSFINVAAWTDDTTLMAACVTAEGSERCYGLAIEKTYDRAGCPAVEPLLQGARTLYFSRRTEHLDPLFRMGLPLYDGLCLAERTGIHADDQERELRAMEQTYHQHISLVFPKTLMLLAKSDIDRAYTLALETYLSPTFVPVDLSPKVVNLLRTQADALCLLRVNDRVACHEKAKAFAARFANVPRVEAQVQWAMNRSLLPFMAHQ